MHSQYTELMSLALDHEADAGQLAALEAHLRACHECAATWARWQMLDARLRAAPMLVPPPHLAGQVMARLAARRQRAGWGGWFGVALLAAWLLTFGGLLLAIIAGAVWALTYPAQASIVLSAGARLLSGLLWPLRSAAIALTSAGVSLQVVAVVWLAAVCALCATWIRLALCYNWGRPVRFSL